MRSLIYYGLKESIRDKDNVLILTGSSPQVSEYGIYQLRRCTLQSLINKYLLRKKLYGLCWCPPTSSQLSIWNWSDDNGLKECN